MKCERCGKEVDTVRCSMFNTEWCCMSCIEKEKKHPLYNYARERELEEVKKGNYNYEGVGKPDDLD